MVFKRSSRRGGTVARRRPYKRRRAPIRKSFGTYYKFTRWDHTANYSWYINRSGITAWQVEPNPNPQQAGNIYSMKCIRPRISLSQVISNDEFIALFRWFKIVTVTTYIDLNYNEPPEFMAQKTAATIPASSQATYAPPTSGQIYRPSRLYRVFTWYDKTSADYQPTDQFRLPEVKQIPSLKINTARKRVVMKCRPKGIITGQITGQHPGPPAPPPLQAPMIQMRSSDWISTDQARTNFFGPVIGLQPLCPVSGDIPAWWGIDFTIDQKYVILFKSTR